MRIGSARTDHDDDTISEGGTGETCDGVEGIHDDDRTGCKESMAREGMLMSKVMMWKRLDRCPSLLYPLLSIL